MAPHLTVAFDIGTANTAAAFGVGNDDQLPTEVHHVSWEFRKITMPSIVAWDENGRFRCGFDLEAAVKATQNKVSPLLIIQHAKMALCEGSKLKAVPRIKQQLKDAGNKTLEDLFAAQLEVMKTLAVDYIARSDFRANFTKAEILAMPLKVRLTLPQMWTPDARRTMQNAARRAGLPLVTLVGEPQSALADTLRTYAGRSKTFPTQLKAGSSILTMDGGCGTADTVHLRLLDDLSINTRFEALTQPTGSDCGSGKVNEFALEIFKQRINTEESEGVQGILDHLSIDEDYFDWQALLGIEQAKLRFSNGDNSYQVSIVDARGRAGLVFFIHDTELKAALDSVIDEIFQLVDDQIATHIPGLIVATGGFATSPYLMNKMHARYEEQRGITVVRPAEFESGECVAVSKGALSARYHSISAQQLPSQYGYGLLGKEVYIRTKHTDIPIVKTYQRRNQKGMEYPVHIPDSKYAPKSPYNKDRVVFNRLTTIIEKGTVIASGQTYDESLFRDYFIPANSPQLSEQLVYFTKKFENSLPGVATDGTYVDGVKNWTSLNIALTRERLQKHGFQSFMSSGGFTDDNQTNWVDPEETFHILGRLLIQCVGGENLRVGFEIIKPEDEEESEDEDGDGDIHVKVAKVVDEDAPWVIWETVFDKDHSDFLEEQDDGDRMDVD